jgi:hypothetical protein
MPGGIASRPFRDNELNAVINALDKNHDGVIGRNELMISDPNRFRRMDTNHNGRLEASEAKSALKSGDISNISFNGDRAAAVQVLLKFDSNQDGMLSRNEFEMTPAAVRTVDGYGSSKYSYQNGQQVTDDKGRIRSTGSARADGQVSISELANALADNRFVIGQALNFN